MRTLKMSNLSKQLKPDQSVFSRFGIYGLENMVNGRVYIGLTSTPFIVRWRRHRVELRMGHHPRQEMQDDWSQCGDNAFRFFIIEEASSPTNLAEREKFHVLDWARTIGIELLYNSFMGFPGTKKEFGITFRVAREGGIIETRCPPGRR